MKYALYQSNNPNLGSVHLKLGQPRTFFCSGRTVMLIDLSDAETGDVLVIQPKKIFHKGPIRNAETGDLTFLVQSSFDVDFSGAISRLQSEVEHQVIDYLSNEKAPNEIPFDYRLLAREAKRSRERLEALQDEPSERNLTSRCEEYALAERRSRLMKPSFKECKMWLKAVSDFRVFDGMNRIIKDGESELCQGDYDFGVRIGDVYIGPHGDTGYIASLQCRIVQVRYTAGANDPSGQMDLNTCILLCSSVAERRDGEENVKRRKVK